MQELRDAILGFRTAAVLHVAATLDLTGHLADGPLAVSELAVRAGADADALRRLMRALAALGVYREEPGDVFAMTPLGEALAVGHPSALHATAANVGRPYIWNAWADLEHSIRTGENAFEHLNGQDVWTHREQHPDDGAAFDRAMTAQTATLSRSVATAYDFSAMRSVVDVAGNHGSLLAAVLRSAPECRGVLFDVPHIIEAAREWLAAEGVADRCEAVAGDFFEAVPAGHDAYLLKSILHDWGDADCVRILTTIRAAMASSARLLIVERLIGPPNTGLETKLSDLNMLVMPGGRERAADEFAALAEQAGLHLQRVIDTSTDFFVLEVTAS